jgi:hypothetical protein
MVGFVFKGGQRAVADPPRKFGIRLHQFVLRRTDLSDVPSNDLGTLCQKRVNLTQVIILRPSRAHRRFGRGCVMSE